VDACGDDSVQLTPNEQTVYTIQCQFGRLLLFIAQQNECLAKFFDQLWNSGEPYQTLPPFKVSQGLTLLWTSVTQRCNALGNDRAPEVRAQLFDCLLNSDIALLQKGLHLCPVLANMLVQYVRARVTDCKRIIAQQTGGGGGTVEPCDDTHNK
jgi:hypothetical protein